MLKLDHSELEGFKSQYELKGEIILEVIEPWVVPCLEEKVMIEDVSYHVNDITVYPVSEKQVIHLVENL